MAIPETDVAEMGAAVFLADVGGNLEIPEALTAPFLRCAGRAGGQVVFGGTGAAEELQLGGSTDAGLGRVRVTSPLEIGDVATGDGTALRWRPVFTQSAPFVGGMIIASPTITIDPGAEVMIPTLLGDTSIFHQNTAPGFAAYTFSNILPTWQNKFGSNFNLPSMLCFNIGPIQQRSSSGTSTTTSTVGMNFSPQIKASAAGAVMTRTDGVTAVIVSPTHSTVNSSTVNYGMIRGVHCKVPTVALFQPQSGIENIDGYIGLEFDQINFGGTGNVKAVVRSALTPAVNRYFLLNNGGADSDLGGGHLLNCGVVQVLGNGIGNSISYGASGGNLIAHWDGASFVWNPLSGDSMLWSFGTTSHTVQSEDFGSGSELRLGFERFAFGQTTAVGNQSYIFVAPSGRTTSAAGEWADVLLTEGGPMIQADNLGTAAAWKINPMGITRGGFDLDVSATLWVPNRTTAGDEEFAIYSPNGRNLVKGYHRRGAAYAGYA